jgi:hypothetical protein
MKLARNIHGLDITQVNEKINGPKFDPSKRVQENRYWSVFREWKKLFKSLNLDILNLSKTQRDDVYTSFYTDYYNQYFCAKS